MALCRASPPHLPPPPSQPDRMHASKSPLKQFTPQAAAAERAKKAAAEESRRLSRRHNTPSSRHTPSSHERAPRSLGSTLDSDAGKSVRRLASSRKSLSDPQAKGHVRHHAEHHSSPHKHTHHADNVADMAHSHHHPQHGHEPHTDAAQHSHSLAVPHAAAQHLSPQQAKHEERLRSVRARACARVHTHSAHAHGCAHAGSIRRCA